MHFKLPSSIQTKIKSLFSSFTFFEIDWALSYGLSKFIEALILYFTAIFGYFISRLAITDIIEYDEGLADISMFEFFAIIMFAVLLIRYISYSSKTKLSFWQRSIIPLSWTGKFILSGWFFLSLGKFSDINDKSVHFNSFIRSQENIIQVYILLSILLALYISVPSKKLRLSPPQSENKSNAAPNHSSTQHKR